MARRRLKSAPQLMKPEALLRGIEAPEEAEAPIMTMINKKSPVRGCWKGPQDSSPEHPAYTACKMPSRCPGCFSGGRKTLRALPVSLKATPTGLFMPPVITTSSSLPSGRV